MASYMWTLSSLVGAYLDLAIAFFSLCASTVAFLTLKFLGFCGLRLPYPCNGLFGITPNDIQNLQRLLIDFASEKVSNVKLSIKEKYHFNDQNIHLSLRLIGEREDVHSHNGHGFVEMEGEASCSSVSDVRKSSNADRIEFMPRSEFGVVTEGGLEMNGKGMKKYRHRHSVNHCRSFSFSRSDPQCVELQDDQQCPPSIYKEIFNNGTDACCSSDDRHANIVTGFGQRDSFKLDENVFPNDDEHSENDSSSEELNGHAQVERISNDDEKSVIRLLKKKLEEEKATRAALYLELEKERNAAATAAEEAMAMILRLQEEKASFEMEARQYRRIIEEKSVYESDEMDILKEILVKRETEKHLLEKEVEAYRQMIYLGNEQFAGIDDNNERKRFDFSPDVSEDPVLMLSQISASDDTKVMKESKHSDEVISIDKQTSVVALEMESPEQEWNEDDGFQKQGELVCHSYGSQEFQKEMVTIVGASNLAQAGHRLDAFLSLCKSAVSDHLDKNNSLIGEELRLKENTTHQGMETQTFETCREIESHIPGKDECLRHHSKVSYKEIECLSDSSSDKEHHVYDVHVIADGSNLCNKGDKNKEKLLSVNANLKSNPKSNISSEAFGAQIIDVIMHSPATTKLDTHMDANTNSLNLTSWLPPLGPRGEPLISDLQRHSTPAVDNEKLKLDDGVESLGERLKTVQEGREKFILSVESHEKEKVQLKLLEDIACQLQEIRQLTVSEERVVS